ncbi:hypothetical protein IAT38_001636 [Cryptococcus sp. DSM 104549]
MSQATATPSATSPTLVASSSSTRRTPLSTPTVSRHRAPASKAQEDKIQDLQNEVADLRAQLGNRDPHKIVQKHIELLHTYNEIKDGAQSLIGKYALMTNRTIKEVHEELDLPLTD